MLRVSVSLNRFLGGKSDQRDFVSFGNTHWNGRLSGISLRRVRNLAL